MSVSPINGNHALVSDPHLTTVGYFEVVYLVLLRHKVVLDKIDGVLYPQESAGREQR